MAGLGGPKNNREGVKPEEVPVKQAHPVRTAASEVDVAATTTGGDAAETAVGQSVGLLAGERSPAGLRNYSQNEGGAPSDPIKDQAVELLRKAAGKASADLGRQWDALTTDQKVAAVRHELLHLLHEAPSKDLVAESVYEALSKTSDLDLLALNQDEKNRRIGAFYWDLSEALWRHGEVERSAGHMLLKCSNDRALMSGGVGGEHALHRTGEDRGAWLTRVATHWAGYLENNGASLMPAPED